MIALLTLTPEPVAAYVGPGAGFVFVTSFLVFFVTGIIALFSLLLWPFRAALRLIRSASRPKPRIKRLIVVGFDGQDPKLTDRFMAEGKLPNFERLAEDGCYHPIQSTYPSISPVAWSSFSTGTHPAKHNIYDFLSRNRKTYLPELSSAHIGPPDRTLKVGRYRIPVGKPDLRLLRKSKPFWTILGEHQIWSTVLRVPITFPPDRFYGAQLSAMCVPDLLGTQGTFTLLTSRRPEGRFKEGGRRETLSRTNGRFEGRLEGPPNEMLDGAPALGVPVGITLNGSPGHATVKVGDTVLELRERELSDWVDVGFKAAPGVTVKGICRMMLTEAGEHVSLYVTPINMDPDKPAMPISHPDYYATYLSKKLGKYSTLGLAEDTWALNEGVMDDGAFLRQTYDIDHEREEMLFAALDRVRSGSVVCVFDATDRIQHMFWRYLEEGHPAARGAPTNGDGRPGGEHADAIEALYVHNDRMVGRIREKMKKGDCLMVLSDHGFTSFRRGINVNAWLHREGYLALKDGCTGEGEWLRDVDWSRTKAYALGLTGIYLNVEGREAEGVVKPGAELRSVKADLVARLSGLRDSDTGEVAINEAFDTSALYSGPYLDNAPDILMGYAEGYRISWDGATGVVAGDVFEDNVKAWSGDHGVDPRIVPGIFFSTLPIDRDDPALIDIAPSVLWLFGIEAPPHMDGRLLYGREAAV